MMGLDRSDSLAVTAIIISLIALVFSIAQVIRQRPGTPKGYQRRRVSALCCQALGNLTANRLPEQTSVRVWGVATAPCLAPVTP
jgi:hypothetical protein